MIFFAGCRLDNVKKEHCMNWQVYIIYCSDASLYTGITTDVLKRFKMHANQQGAKYFRGRHPERIVYFESEHNRSSASKRENFIKKLSREQKMALICASGNRIAEFEKV